MAYCYIYIYLLIVSLEFSEMIGFSELIVMFLNGVQQIQVYMYLTSWPIQYLKRFFCLSKKGNHGPSLQEDLQNS